MKEFNRRIDFYFDLDRQKSYIFFKNRFIITAHFIEEWDHNINVDLDPDLKITTGITIGFRYFSLPVLLSHPSPNGASFIFIASIKSYSYIMVCKVQSNNLNWGLPNFNHLLLI